VLHRVQLKDQEDLVFYQKLMLVYLEMPNFTLELEELEDRKDQWLYFLKNLEDFENIPELFKDEVFEQAFEIAALGRMNSEDQMSYQGSLKVLRDNFGALSTAREEGKAEGVLEGKLQIARGLKASGMELEQIVVITGLTLQELEGL
jgi:predicted transposase/invertase (TIGR01784 family)